MKYRIALAVAAWVAGWTGLAGAAPLIFNTGVDSTGAVVADGTPESHYNGTGGTPTVNSTISATPAPDAASAWILPNELGPGGYALETTFKTDAAEAMTITGRWAAMSQGLYINFNGNYADPGTIADGDTSWHEFTVTATTLSYAELGASNYLTFYIYHPQAGTPLGLRVEITSVTAVPEPGLAVLAAPAAAMALARRRRQS